MLKDGGKSWYILTADYAFGHSMEADIKKVVQAEGGSVVGAVRHPFPSSDFSSYILQAQVPVPTWSPWPTPAPTPSTR